MSKVKTTYYKDGKPVKTVIEDYVPYEDRRALGKKPITFEKRKVNK